MPRVLLGAMASLAAAGASAEDSDAERLFREGRALVVQGRFAEACPRLEQSQRLEPRLGTQLNVAFCHERLGKLATARIGFQLALQTARARQDVARERFAQAHLDDLEPRVPRLRVRAAADASPEQLALRLDTEPLSPSTWDQELPVDPGEHALVATHEGREYWRTTVALREAERVIVAIPAPPALPAIPAAMASGRAERAIASERQAPRATSTSTGNPGEAGRFVYEVGAFVGLMIAATKQSEPEGSPSIRYDVVDDDGNSQILSCDTAVCDYLPFDSAGVVAGAMGFVGYSATPQTHLGLRFLIGPRVGGGAILALGPSASFLFGERFNVAPTVFFGSASHSGQGLVGIEGQVGAIQFESDDETAVQGSLGFSVGVGAEVGWKLVGGASGSLAVQAVPLLFFGANGTAWALPLGVAWRWK